MIELGEWISHARFEPRPWLLVGKGPSFSHRGELDLDTFNVVSLNHVVNEIDVCIAHMADLDVVAACADRLAEHCQWLLMPRQPHVDNRPCGRRLEALFDELPILRRLDQEHRLVWYNLDTAPPIDDSPVIEVLHFSSEPVLDILGRLGAREVFTLGIDGGSSYSTTFAHLSEQTLLANGRPNFDVQFFSLDRIAKKHDIAIRPVVEPNHAESRDLVAARYHIEKLDAELAAARRALARLERSREMRVGRQLIGPVRAARRLLHHRPKGEAG